MSRIRSKDTEPELLLRRALFASGLRYRVHYPILGTPDVAFPRQKLAVFVHGCYFHRHPGCKNATVPKTNTEVWLSKFEANRVRDEAVAQALAAAGWRVLVLWECEVRRSPADAVLTVRAALEMSDL